MGKNVALYLYALGMLVPPAVVVLGALSLLVPRRTEREEHAPVAGAVRA